MERTFSVRAHDRCLRSLMKRGIGVARRFDLVGEVRRRLDAKEWRVSDEVGPATKARDRLTNLPIVDVYGSAEIVARDRVLDR
jgi:hypothetical protein